MGLACSTNSCQSVLRWSSPGAWYYAGRSRMARSVGAASTKWQRRAARQPSCFFGGFNSTREHHHRFEAKCFVPMHLQ